MLSVPLKSEILDIGGGPGHLAFWMAHTFSAYSVTVADTFQESGTLWAKSINEKRVKFVNSHLPELKELDDQKFDAIVLSRILSFIPDLNLPGAMTGQEPELYFKSDEAKMLTTKLEEIGSRLKELLKPNGQVIILESWSDFRVLLIGKAFENIGLHIDFRRFTPDRIGLEYSIIVFSESVEYIPLNDPVYSLSTTVYFHDKYPDYRGTAADSIRILFKDGELKDVLTFKHEEKPIIYRNEIIEKEGLILVYRSSSEGGIIANIYPGVYIFDFKETFDDWRNEIPKDLIINDIKSTS
jgi:SAM-dependent methyltransferase